MIMNLLISRNYNIQYLFIILLLPTLIMITFDSEAFNTKAGCSAFFKSKPAIQTLWDNHEDYRVSNGMVEMNSFSSIINSKQKIHHLHIAEMEGAGYQESRQYQVQNILLEIYTLDISGKYMEHSNDLVDQWLTPYDFDFKCMQERSELYHQTGTFNRVAAHAKTLEGMNPPFRLGRKDNPGYVMRYKNRLMMTWAAIENGGRIFNVLGDTFGSAYFLSYRMVMQKVIVLLEDEEGDNDDTVDTTRRRKMLVICPYNDELSKKQQRAESIGKRILDEAEKSKNAEDIEQLSEQLAEQLAELFVEQLAGQPHGHIVDLIQQTAEYLLQQ